ncbi:MAG: hypothetical protein GY796_34035 [Chloroflexi bacterium]|nr:hypothetical protein [Chloroflexota bacterium]
MMSSHVKGIVVLLIFLLMGGLACAVPGFTPAAPAPSPTPPGDMLFLQAPYTYNLTSGGRVPGTQLEYIEATGDSFRMRIDGAEATKRIGDSFPWKGVVGPGVLGNYNLRLTTALGGNLPAVGTVKLTVLNPEPQEVVTAVPPVPEKLHYGGIIINYNVPVGREVPGSTMVFEGVSNQSGITAAQLSGISGYAFFAQGDSLVWQGQLRENVYVRYDLRVVTLSEENLLLGGTAELWITPSEP